MGRNEELRKILDKKFGIRNLSDLNRAIAKIGTIDISPFVDNEQYTNSRLKEKTDETF